MEEEGSIWFGRPYSIRDVFIDKVILWLQPPVEANAEIGNQSNESDSRHQKGKISTSQLTSLSQQASEKAF